MGDVNGSLRYRFCGVGETHGKPFRPGVCTTKRDLKACQGGHPGLVNGKPPDALKSVDCGGLVLGDAVMHCGQLVPVGSGLVSSVLSVAFSTALWLLLQTMPPS